MAIKSTKLYDDQVEIVFNSKRHTYTMGGKYLPSATGVTGMLNKDLAKWGAQMAAQHFKKNVTPGEPMDEIAIRSLAESMEKASENYRDDAALVGDLAHDWIHQYVNLQIAGKVYDEPQRPVNDLANTAIDSFLQFIGEHDIAWEFAERIVYYTENADLKDPLGMVFVGTADIGAVMDGVFTVLDWKTGKNIYREHGLQAAAYCKAWDLEQPGKGFTAARGIVHIPARTGKLDYWDSKRIMNDLTGQDINADFAVFKNLLLVYRWHQKNQYYWQKKYARKR